MDSLNEILIQDSREKNICAEGFRQLHDLNKEGLVDYYLSIPDWCLERDFPTLQMLSEKFADCEDKGVYVNKTFHGELLNDLQTYIFHNCKGTIKVGLNIEKAIIPMLYLANGCRLRIMGVGDIIPKKPSEVPVYVFGKNDHTARDNKYVKFNIFKHGLI